MGVSIGSFASCTTQAPATWRSDRGAAGPSRTPWLRNGQRAHRSAYASVAQEHVDVTSRTRFADEEATTVVENLAVSSIAAGGDPRSAVRARFELGASIAAVPHFDMCEAPLSPLGPDIRP